VPAEAAASVVLVGLESVGKSAIFRGLTGAANGGEANFRGSTVVCRRCPLQDCDCELVDTPGIRVEQDSATTQLALATLAEADTVLLVVRAPYLTSEAQTLLRTLRVEGRRLAVAITFADKVTSGLSRAVRAMRERLEVPVITLNAREMSAVQRAELVGAIQEARPLATSMLRARGSLVQLHAHAPHRTVFEQPRLGAVLALGAMLALLALPVVAAFQLASWLQPYVDATLIGPVSERAGLLWPPLAAVLVGPYGLLTLGSYSFLWAFPVVVLLGVASSLAEESGLHDRITAALDPWLRHIGLSGRDLVPVLTGFGCNVVAVMHSRACSSCSRRACVSLISFGSACSYQIGAGLSLFGAAGLPGLFAPYLATVFVVGLVHTRIWHGSLARPAALPLHERAYLQAPSLNAVSWRVSGLVKQFMLQAMPVFLVLCVVSALIEQTGAMTALSTIVTLALGPFDLPEHAALAVVMSVFRKDGMLLMNTSLASISAGQLFIAVYLASTLSPCLVTLATVRRELGWNAALSVAGKQAVTSVVSAWMLRLIVQ
jgi:ferrous iron transport protein B